MVSKKLRDPSRKPLWVRGLVVAAVCVYILYDNPDWIGQFDELQWFGWGAALLAGVGLAKSLESRGWHLTFRQHRMLPYVLIFPLLVVIPFSLYWGWNQLAGGLVLVTVCLYLTLHYIVGASCPQCAARLQNVPTRRGLFAPLRQVRYRCRKCQFEYDRFDTEDPPF